MRAIFLFLFIFLGIHRNAFAQPITWNADRPLTWDDFQPRSKAKRLDAATHGRFLEKFDYCKRDSAHLTVTAVFDPILSWKKRNGMGAALLKHEQVHFDIVELYVRRLRKEMREDEDRDHHTKQWLTDACHRKVVQMHHCQKKYDRQTRHSRRRKAQWRWNNKVSTELAELNDYAD